MVHEFPLMYNPYNLYILPATFLIAPLALLSGRGVVNSALVFPEFIRHIREIAVLPTYQPTYVRTFTTQTNYIVDLLSPSTSPVLDSDLEALVGLAKTSSRSAVEDLGVRVERPEPLGLGDLQRWSQFQIRCFHRLGSSYNSCKPSD